MRDGREIARENEVKVLRALHRCGWLSSRQIGALAWQPWSKSPSATPDLTPPVATASGWRMAQRTLRRLFDRKQVLRSRAPNGSLIYALSEAGARRLQQLGVPASSGKDLIRSFSAAQFLHRSIANSVFIGGLIAGFKCSSENEIARDRWIGTANGIAGKKADVVLQGNGQIWWIEIERSRKSARDYAKLLSWLNTVANDAFQQSGSVLLGKGLRWAKVVFICTAAFEAKLCRDLMAAGWKKSAIDALICFETELYHFVDILFV
jgi:hypothetical protein